MEEQKETLLFAVEAVKILVFGGTTYFGPNYHFCNLIYNPAALRILSYSHSLPHSAMCVSCI